MVKTIKSFLQIEWKMKLLYLLWVFIIIWLFLAMEVEVIINNINNLSTTTASWYIQSIEKNNRSTARYMAVWIWECIKQHNFSTIWEMEDVIRMCWAEHRSWWPTWDFFVFDRVSRTIVYDWSPDCMKDWELRAFDYMLEKNNKEDVWECWMHQDRWLCVSAIEKLYNLWNTDDKSNIYWKFDDSYEWLESYVIPSLTYWFKWPIWNKWVFNLNNIQLQIVVWTQKDEVMSEYKEVGENYNLLNENINKVNFLIHITLWWVVIISIIMFFITTLILKLK